MGTLRDKATLDALLADNTNRQITEETLRDVVESLISVYGHLGLSNPGTHFDCNGSWQTFNLWTTSRDTRGISENLTTGEFTLLSGAAGIWRARIDIDFTVSVAAGTYRFRPRIIHSDNSETGMGADCARVESLDIGTQAQWVMLGMSQTNEDLVEGDRLVAQVRGPNGGRITPIHGYFECDRK